MLALLFGPPVVFAFALGLFGAASKRRWVVAAVSVACLQVLILAAVSPREQWLNVVLFSTLLPWLAVVALLSVSALPRRSVLVALLLPFVFAATLFAGIIVGVNVGLLLV